MDQNQNQQQSGHAQDNVPKTDPKQLDSSFQRDITDAEVFKSIFYKKLCGYIEKSNTIEKEFLGDKVTETNVYYDINFMARLCNESCANFLFSDVYPLISRAMNTSNVDKMEIYHLWDGKMVSLEFALLDSYFIGIRMPDRDITFDEDGRIKTVKLILDNKGLPKYTLIKNPYELDYVNIPDIICFLQAMFGITNKAKDGFTMIKLADSYDIHEIRRTGIDTRDPGSGGMFNDIVNKVFPGKKGN